MTSDKGRFNGLTPTLTKEQRGYPAEYAHSSSQGSVSTHPEPTFNDLFRGVRARYLAVIVPPILLGFGAWVYCCLQHPLYTARSVIEIKGYAPLLAAATVENMYGADTRKLEYQKTTIAKLKQPGVAERVLNDDGLLRDLSLYFNVPVKEGDQHAPLAPTRKLINGYLGLIDINPVSETSLVEISATTRNPELSARVANAHAAGFIEALRAERRESMRTNITALELQESELRQRLTDAERAMAEYSEESHLVVGNSGDSKDVALQKLMGLNELLAQATEKRLRSEAAWSNLSSVDIKKSTALDNDSIRDTVAALETLESQYVALGQKVTPEYPEMKDIKARIDSLKSSISRQRQQLLADLKIRLDGEKAAEDRLVAQITTEEKALNVNSKKMGRLLILRKESDSLRQLYENVLKQLQETKISASSGVSNIFLSDIARPSLDSAYPRTKLFVVLASILGLAFGLLYAVAAELLDSRIKSSDDAAHSMGVPVLGVLPRFMDGAVKQHPVVERAKKLLPWRVPATRQGIESSQEATTPKNDDTVATPPQKIDVVVMEALKTIRAGILLSSVDSPVRVIAVTSANKGEGKSTIAINLAASLAQAEYSTLLIDGDFRESRMVEAFPALKDKGGLSELLAHNPEAIPIEPISLAPFLKVLPCGKRPPNPTEMLGSKRMAAALESFRKGYDFVIIDCPPVLPVADTLMLAHEVEGVIIVTRSEKTQRRHAREAVQRLQRVHANVIGVVVNDSNLQREEVYGAPENYQYYSGGVQFKKAG